MRVLFAEPPKDFWLILGSIDRSDPRPLSAALITLASAMPSPAIRQDRKLRKLNMLSLTLTIVALLCLCLIAALTLSSKAAQPPPPKQYAGLFFGIICTLGATAAVVPSKCSRPLHGRRGNRRDSIKEATNQRGVVPVLLRGHHPACGSFTAHVFWFRGKAYCAGCLGLFTGALLAVAGGLIYFLDLVNVGDAATFVFWLGFFGVSAGLCQYAKPFASRASTHFLMNLIFVLGAFVLLAGTIEISSSAALEAYVLVATVYWIFTRIILSQWEHQKTCVACKSFSCSNFGS